MADFPTFAELRDVARAELLARNGKITVDAVDRDGTDANVLVNAIAAVGDELIGQISRVEASLLLGAARGKDLDRVAYDRYGLLRTPASPSVGSVSFTTTVATAGSFSIPSGTALAAADGSQFLTTESTTFPISSTGPIVVAIRAANAGLATQAASDTITNIASPIPGAPGDLAVDNPLATAGGADAETDDQLRARALAFFTTARRGTAAAIEQAALAVAGVKTAMVFEVTDGNGQAARSVQLVVSDAFTEQLAKLAVAPPAYETQSQALGEAVFAGLSNARAAGIFVDVTVAKVILQPVILALSFRAGADANQVALQCRARIVSFVNSLRPGQNFRVADAAASLQPIPGLVPTGAEIVVPAGDVVLQPLEVLRTTMGLVTASSLQPDRRLAGTTNPDSV